MLQCRGPTDSDNSHHLNHHQCINIQYIYNIVLMNSGHTQVLPIKISSNGIAPHLLSCSASFSVGGNNC